jgi:hypothetical protein
MRLRVALVLTLLSWCAGVCALAAEQSAANPAAVPAVKHYPDEGLLSNYRYANAFFGFSIDLPADAGLRPIPSSNPTDGSIALLETLGSPPHKSVMAISAYPSGENGPNARLLLRRELDEELTIGVEELHALSTISIAGHRFFYYETRRGIDQHAIYATDLDGYALRFITAGRDPKMLQQLEAAIVHMRFFPPASISDYAGVGAVPYSGPAIPSHLIEELKSDPPARKLADGKVSDNIYENAFLGFGYQLPKNWHYGTEAAIMPAVERSREQNYDRPAVSPSQHTLLKACERTLVSAWRKRPQQTGQISYDDFGEVTLSAMSLACFPNVKFPDAPSNKVGLTDFMIAYGLGHPIVQDMRGVRAFEHDGRTFLVMKGVVAYHEDGEALSRRVSVALALTKQRGYLVSFFFAAPHDAELHELMNAKASFDPEPVMKTTTASAPPVPGALQPGGSAAASSSATPASEAPAANSRTASAATPANPATPVAAEPQANPPAAASDPTASSTFHPSLLRPGETMQDQQMHGTPIPRKSH